mmetsp:Transcript_43616/g.100861  ORF Transcript_43616/g.100861 Transcript_43616/m.100861 type:complete len:173 (+) Transcript_43616:2-520(+)
MQQQAYYSPGSPPMQQYVQSQGMGATSMYGQPGVPQFTHQMQHMAQGYGQGYGVQGRASGGQAKHYAAQQGKNQNQYAEYQVPAAGYTFSGTPYGAQAGNASLNMPSSLGGMQAAYPQSAYADPSGYTGAQGYARGYEGLSSEYAQQQGMYAAAGYAQGPQPGMFPQGHNGN